MDGNRRWAKQRLLPSNMWHKEWFKNAKHVIETFLKTSVSHITLWALSKENLENRSQEELTWLFSLFNKFFDLLPLMMEHNIQFQTIGDTQKLPQDTQKILEEMKQKTLQNTGLTVIIALVYSGQDEMIRAMKKAQSSGIDIQSLNETSFRQFLDTAQFPPVDLIIRTWGDTRHSWFLLYDSAYSEYAFTQTLFPDFKSEEIFSILKDFEKRERRFWK